MRLEIYLNAVIAAAGIVSMQAAGLLGQSVDFRWIYAGAGTPVLLSGPFTPLLVHEPAAVTPAHPGPVTTR